MKKLMIAAAIVCAAAMSQAASIMWSSSKNYVTKDGTTQTAATADAGKFVLCYLGNTTDGYSWDKATVVNEGTVAYSTSMGGTAKATGTYTWTYGADGTPANGDVFGVMFRDTEGNLSQLVTPGDSPSPIAEAFTVTGMGDNLYQGAMVFSSSSNYTVASVPEPTSAMLLLLGVAGMALRRRRA